MNSIGLSLIPALATLGAADRPRFHGPNGGGVSAARGLPVEFGPGKNVAWKAPEPAGASSPVVAGGRVFLAGYDGDRRLVSCLDLKTGRKLSERTLAAARPEKKSKPNDAASSTPATDSRNVYALFSGFGLVAYSVSGEEKWRVPLPPFTQPHGMSSSPVLAGNAVIVVADQVADSWIAAFDARTRKLKWKTPRGNFVGGYTTPILCAGAVVVSGPAELAGYSPSTGERMWSLPRMGVMPMGSPVCEGDRIWANKLAVPPFEQLLSMKSDRNGDGKITPDEFPDPSFKEAVLAIDRAYGNGDAAVDAPEWDGALKLMQTLNALVAGRLEGGQPRELWRATKACPMCRRPCCTRVCSTW